MKVSDEFTCICCGGRSCSDARPFVLRSPADKALFGDRAIVRCDDCGLFQIDRCPTDEQLETYYSSTYRKDGQYGPNQKTIDRFPYDNPRALSRGRALRDLHDRFSNAAERQLRVLEIGSGYGYNLSAFRERSETVSLTALEPDAGCIKHLEKLGASVFPRMLTRDEDVGDLCAEGKFDVVILAHVLEHVPDPVKFLSRTLACVAKSGHLLIEVPNCPAAYKTWHHTPHVGFYDADSLAGVAERAGGLVDFVSGCASSIPERVRRVRRHEKTPRLLLKLERGLLACGYRFVPPKADNNRREDVDAVVARVFPELQVKRKDRIPYAVFGSYAASRDGGFLRAVVRPQS